MHSQKNHRRTIEKLRYKHEHESQDHVLKLLKILTYESAFQERLKKLVENIVQEYQSTPRITAGSKVYDKIREDVEAKYAGKTVAIDIEHCQVVGVGNTIEEAYEKALSNSDKKKFYFRKVGKDYLIRV